jgi:hypothetical protein
MCLALCPDLECPRQPDDRRWIRGGVRERGEHRRHLVCSRNALRDDRLFGGRECRVRQPLRVARGVHALLEVDGARTYCEAIELEPDLAAAAADVEAWRRYGREGRSSSRTRTSVRAERRGQKLQPLVALVSASDHILLHEPILLRPVRL